MLTSNLSLKTMLKFLPGPQDVEKEILSSEKVNIPKTQNTLITSGNCHEKSLASYEYNRKDSCLFLRQNTIMKVSIHSIVCENCGTLNYPNLSNLFLINFRENFNN